MEWQESIRGRQWILNLDAEHHFSWYHVDKINDHCFEVWLYDANPRQSVPGNTGLAVSPSTLAEAKEAAEEHFLRGGGEWLSR